MKMDEEEDKEDNSMKFSQLEMSQASQIEADRRLAMELAKATGFTAILGKQNSGLHDNISPSEQPLVQSQNIDGFCEIFTSNQKNKMVSVTDYDHVTTSDDL